MCSYCKNIVLYECDAKLFVLALYAVPFIHMKERLFKLDKGGYCRDVPWLGHHLVVDFVTYNSKVKAPCFL